MSQLKTHIPHQRLKVPHVAMKTRHSQVSIFKMHPTPAKKKTQQKNHTHKGTLKNSATTMYEHGVQSHGVIALISQLLAVQSKTNCLTSLSLMAPIIKWYCDVWVYFIIQLYLTLWAAAHQAILSIEFPRQEYWDGLLFSSPGDLHWSRGQTCVTCITGEFFTTEPLGKPVIHFKILK